MQERPIHPDDPYRFTLAVDARTALTDYANDQIWELVIGKVEPPAITLQTTFGLRARSLRIFPRFGEADELQSDPGDFASPIVLRRYCPNLIRLEFVPLPEIAAELVYWVSSSQSICGKMVLTNSGKTARNFKIEIAGNLIPDSQGTLLSASEIDAITVLTGQTGGLQPVLFVVGGAQATNSPFPALSVNIDLPINSARTLAWVLAALPELQDSLNLARKQAARNWDAEITRSELLDEGCLTIHTGEPDWDLALDLAHTIAFSLFLSPTSHLPYPSIVVSRQADQGYSLRGDGSDYNHLWNGQSPLEAYTLSNLILPTAPELVKGMILNYLSTQTPDGMVDGKPGLAGQRSQFPATPLLASLAWLYYEFTEDHLFLQETFQELFASLKSWGSPLLDRDNDGMPEWSHPYQTSLDDHPLFSYWQPWSLGREISTVESPDLCAYLYHECTVLQKIARLIHRNDAIGFLKTTARRLKNRCNTFWDPTESIYRYQDRDAHNCAHLQKLGEVNGSGTMWIQEEFESPARLQIYIYSQEPAATRRVVVFLHGSGPGDIHRVERLTTEVFKWYPGRGTATSERLYTEIEHIEIRGLMENDRCAVYLSGLSQKDVSLLLPLWARLPSLKIAQRLIEKTILNPDVFLSDNGLRTYLAENGAWLEAPPQFISIPWNQLVIEGLLAYQHRQEAADIYTRLMKVITKTLTTEGGFRRVYDAETGQGSGDLNALHGLPPIGLFLKVLGVRFITPKKIFVEGFNPFPWPVTVKYRGTTILRQKGRSTAIFPDGQTITTDRTSPTILSLG